MTKIMMNEKGLPLAFWTEMKYMVVYLLNWCPTKAVENKTPFKAWSGGRKSSVNHLKVFLVCLLCACPERNEKQV
jgi:hypothetical protein